MPKMLDYPVVAVTKKAIFLKVFSKDDFELF
jgi:hypothetical protein